MLVTREHVQSVLDGKTKPVGSLGRLEALAVELCVQQQSLAPNVDAAHCILFAADHGISRYGVSLYPREVTAQMVANFARGGAAACVLARLHGCGLEIVDVGVDADLSGLADIRHLKIRAGTAPLHLEAAMSESECRRAMHAGATLVERAVADGKQVVILGEMGIGNSTSAAALLAALCELAPADCVGRGTGIDPSQRAHKVRLVEQALARPMSRRPESLLCELGGIEIAALVGALLALEKHPVSVLIDGFIVSVAALLAVRIAPATRARMLFAHRSMELGHDRVLHELEAQPMLDWHMRLGEGSGALLALPLLRAAAAIVKQMASFADAGVSTASPSNPITTP